VVPSDAVPGALTIFAHVEAASGISEQKTDNNTISEDVGVRWRFGSWDEDGDGKLDRKNVKLKVNDFDGTQATFSMSGSGYGEVDGPARGTTADNAFNNLSFYNTNLKSKATIKTKELRGVSVGGVKVNDVIAYQDLGELKASTTDLGRMFNATGAVSKVLMGNAVSDTKELSMSIGSSLTPPSKGASVFFNKVKNLSMTSNTPYGSIAVAEWQDTGTPDTIFGPSIYKLESKGDRKAGLLGNFAADVMLTDMSSTVTAFTVNGLIDGIDFRTPGSIKATKFGAAQDSKILAGMSSGLSVLPSSSGAITNPNSSIGSVKMSGKVKFNDIFNNGNQHSYSNTIIASDSLGSLQLVGVERFNSGVQFGLAADTFKSLKVKQPDNSSYTWNTKTNSWKTTPAGGWQNFQANII